MKKLLLLSLLLVGTVMELLLPADMILMLLELLLNKIMELKM